MTVALTNEEATFEAAILANPDDATPRLVYADWQDEHSNHAFAAWLRSNTANARETLRFWVELNSDKDAARIPLTTVVESVNRWTNRLQHMNPEHIPNTTFGNHLERETREFRLPGRHREIILDVTNLHHEPPRIRSGWSPWARLWSAVGWVVLILIMFRGCL